MCPGPFGVQMRWRRAHSPDLPSQGPTLLPAPQKWGSAASTGGSGGFWLLESPQAGRTRGRHCGKGTPPSPHPVGSRDPVPGSLPG